MKKSINCQHLIGLIGCTIILAGCSATAKNSTHMNSAAVQPLMTNTLPVEAGKVLSEYPNDVVVEMDSSQQRLEAESVYYSASGKNCRAVNLITTADDSVEPLIACEEALNIWTLNRALP